MSEVRRRGISRLCHFTRAASLAHILASGTLRDVEDLRDSAEGYRPTDDRRLDGHLGHISFSLEYPNSWYFKEARKRDDQFLEWVVLTVDPVLLDTPGTRFCPHNAARHSGSGIQDGLDGFNAMFADRVGLRLRDPEHPSWWPTDDQAEVLIPGPIPVSAVRSVILQSADQAALEDFRLGEIGLPAHPPFVIAPDLFETDKLSSQVRTGLRPIELAHGDLYRPNT
ncbi:DarT ssDNA thymidine ADP-ribosyltransferase family protein [Amycolatopsis sp. cmx-11-12]|uniref:DarT ssDNA thymidine ADP-ribosyltransferase family protein n=1 Tax=Amycolatopsis sp. cmx-11-12 TaxID=2785795 RepID=UPI003917C5B9